MLLSFTFHVIIVYFSCYYRLLFMLLSVTFEQFFWVPPYFLCLSCLLVFYLSTNPFVSDLRVWQSWCAFPRRGAIDELVVTFYMGYSIPLLDNKWSLIYRVVLFRSGFVYPILVNSDNIILTFYSPKGILMIVFVNAIPMGPHYTYRL